MAYPIGCWMEDVQDMPVASVLYVGRAGSSVGYLFQQHLHGSVGLMFVLLIEGCCGLGGT